MQHNYVMRFWDNYFC